MNTPTKHGEFCSEAQDCGSRRHAITEFSFSAAQHCSLYENTPVGILLTAPEGRILAANPAARSMLGRTEGQLRTLARLDLVKPGDPRTAGLLAEREKTGCYQGELTLVRGDGSTFDAEVTSVVATNEDEAITSMVIRDVTERKRLEARVKEQAQWLDIANEAIFATDLEHRIIFWNAGAERMGGRKAADMVGCSLYDLLNDEGIFDPQVLVAASQLTDWRGTLSCRHLNGTLRVVTASATVLRDTQGKPTGRLCICGDITEQTQLKEKYERAQRLESLGMLAAGIAHDMNNILAPVLMGAPLLRRVATEPGDLRLIATLEKSAERGASLVRQILGFAHGVGGEPQLVQVKHLFRDIINVATETFPKSIEIDHLVPSDLWPVRANPTQIHQVLLNLCVNARDAMPQGGALRLRAENCVLDAAAAAALEGARPGEWIVLHVEDTGMGIPPELVARIWEPFFTTKTADKGTGLGLSTVRGIVATHQGFITLSTAAERGTTFRVYLPAAEVRASIDPVAPVPPPISGQGELILLVDDEALIRDMAGVTLTRAGYRVLFAADGIEAMALFKARAHEIDLVVTDLDMPNLDGASLIQLIRFRNPTTRLLTISGLNGTHRLIQSRPGQSEAPYLPKPFTIDELYRAIRQALERATVGAPTGHHGNEPIVQLDSNPAALGPA